MRKRIYLHYCYPIYVISYATKMHYYFQKFYHKLDKCKQKCVESV